MQDGVMTEKIYTLIYKHFPVGNMKIEKETIILPGCLMLFQPSVIQPVFQAHFSLLSEKSWVIEERFGQNDPLFDICHGSR